MARALGMWAMLAALAVPGAAWAERAVIRIEAKRGAASAETAAARWRMAFPDVVTFALPGGWTAIALGPMTPEAARARLAALKAAGQVPADSFVATPGEDVALTAATESTAPADPGADGASAADGAAGIAAPDAATPGATSEAAPSVAAVDPAPAVPDPAKDAPVAAAPAVTPPTAASDAETGAVPQTAPAAATHLIVLERFDTAQAARDALGRWRADVPEAGVWAEGAGAAVALGPVTEATAAAWAGVFRDAGSAPDAAAVPQAALGAALEPGAVPDLAPPPPAPAPLPPVEDVQRALRWAGLYDGPIDGEPGPGTRAAMTREMAALRLSPDPGTAMERLIARRADWTAAMGLTRLADAHTGLALNAPMDRLAFDRAERSLSIYAPKDGSGAALILFSAPGGQQEMLDHLGLVTALGWVPRPERGVSPGRATLRGGDRAHLGQAEAWVRDGRAEGFVLIWPATVPGAADDLRRLAAEMSDSLTRTGGAANDAD